MAVTVLDTINNQWFVQRKDGELELCHNRATANLLCREYNKKEEETKTARLAGLYGRRSLISGQSGSMAGFRRSLFGATDSSTLG